MAQLERSDINKLAELGTHMEYLRKKADDTDKAIQEIKYDIRHLYDDQSAIKHQLKNLDTNVKELNDKTDKNITELEIKTTKVTRFFKNNWYRFLPFITAFLGGLGVYIAEYLHNLPPPIRK